MMPIKKFSRATVLLSAAVITVITGMIVANAVQTITTPNAAFIAYNLASGAISAPITPAASRAVLVMGVCNAPGNQGVGQVTLLRTPGVNVRWIGLESPPGAGIAAGIDGGAGTHIVDVSSTGDVDIEVNGPDTIRVHNSTPIFPIVPAKAGNVTLIW